MLYVISHRYFVIEHILAGLSGRADIRVFYYEVDILPKSRIGKWLWLVDGLTGTNFCRADAYVDPLREEFRSLNPEDRVLFFDIWNPAVFLQTAAILPTKHISLWLWNSGVFFSRHAWRRRILFALFKRKSERVCTFDHADAARYGIIRKEQVYNPYPGLPADTEANAEMVDLFFAGADKGRLGTLLELRAAAEREGLVCHYHLVASRPAGSYTSDESRHFAASKISYEEMLLRIGRTRSLIEIVQPGQHGCTLRAMEALFFGKKLITDNPAVEREAFYRPENVYRLGREERSLREFLDQPMAEVPSAVIDRYDITRWIDAFLD